MIKTSQHTLQLIWLECFFSVLTFLFAQFLFGSSLFGIAILAAVTIFVSALQRSMRLGICCASCGSFLYFVLWLYFPETDGEPTLLSMVFALLLTIAAGAVSGHISQRTHAQLKAHAESVQRSSQLSDISTDLLTASSEDILYHLTLTNLYDVTGMACTFYTVRDNRFCCVKSYPAGLICYPTETDAAQAAFSQQQETGFGTNDFSVSAFRYFPVVSGDKILAVVGILCNYETPPPAYLLETTRKMLIRVAVALDNLRLLRKQQSILIEKELEHIRTDFMRAISHDFRTPLTGIIGACSALSEESEAAVNLSVHDRTSLIDSINEEASWLLRMVENLLAVTRIEAGGTQLHKTPQPIEEILSEAIERTRKRFPSLSLQIEQPAEFLMIPMDATLIIQVLMNLIENAVKYSAPSLCEQKITVDIKVTDFADAVSFSIRDYGEGLSPSRLENPFTPVSLPIGDSNHKGMGLGLSICQSIITAHDGTISAANHPEGGAVFTITLPK